MNVLDASALLAYLQGEGGAVVVEAALGDRLDTPVLTADRSWGETGRVRQVR